MTDETDGRNDVVDDDGDFCNRTTAWWMCATPKKSGAINDTRNATEDEDGISMSPPSVFVLLDEDIATTNGGTIHPRKTISSVNGASM